MEENRLVVIDGNSLINRAYYAIQRPMITKEGLYTHGVYGFLTMLAKIRTDYNPGYLAVTFDRKAPTFRHIEYTEYKAGRKKMPPELVMQMPLLKEVLDAMKIKRLEIDGFEADDIIGTVAVAAEKAGFEPLIITGDKDELQLATDVTKVLITKKGISEFELYDRTAMIEKYGFTPEQFIDYKGLMGDPSDHIPGVPGVGAKTAEKLILQFGSVANLIAHTDEIEGAGLRKKIEENVQLAVMSRRLATIVTEVPIEIDFEEFRMEEPDYDQLIELYKKLEFNSFLKKLSKDGKNGTPFDVSIQKTGAFKSSENRKEMGKEAADQTDTRQGTEPCPSDEMDEFESLDQRPLRYLSQPDELKELEEELQNELKKEGFPILKVFSDHNHKDRPIIHGISILTNESNYFIPTPDANVVQAFCNVLERCPVSWCGHQLQSDYYALLGYWEGQGELFHTGFDTAIAQYLLDPSRSQYDLKTLILENFHLELSDEKEFFTSQGQIGFLSDDGESQQACGQYGARWCGLTARLMGQLKVRLEQENLVDVFEQVELPLIWALASMEHHGFAVDQGELSKAGEYLNFTAKQIAEKIYELAGETFNINSPKQLGPILFEKLKLPGGKKTKTGYATGAEILERLAGDYEIAAKVLEYRMLTKLNGTYVEGVLPLIHKDGKIHAHFQQTVTATGRISCTEPNLQNIPVRHELGRSLRRCYVPESSDYILVGADYSQIELRVLAHMSGDPALIEAFNQKQDIHRITAAKVFGVSEEEVTSLQRSNAKAVNFGVIYGMSGFGLSSELHITRKEAEQYIQEYFKKYTKVKEFMEEQVEKCKRDGYVTTLMNRRRRIPEIHASNYMTRQLGERLAMNSPIQGSAADIIKLAMIRVEGELERQKLKSSLILQVHDELIIQTHKEELETVKKLLVENMEEAVKLDVTLSVDLNVGDNWYGLK